MSDVPGYVMRALGLLKEIFSPCLVDLVRSGTIGTLLTDQSGTNGTPLDGVVCALSRTYGIILQRDLEGNFGVFNVPV